MELRHLRYFLAVADALNFSRAAARLRVAQPSLSRQIHDLEEELGFRLFERTTTQVSLTDAGRYFRPQVEKLLGQLDISITSAQQLAKGKTVSFKIGCDWNASALPITTAARLLREQHPEVTVDFVELAGHAHPEAVRARKIDVGFVAGLQAAARSDLQYSHLYAGPLLAILPEAHELAARSALKLRDLRNERWLVMTEEEVPGFKALMTQICRPAQFTPKFGRSASSLKGMLALVGTAEGIALIPELFLPPRPDEVRYIQTDCAPFELFAVWSKIHPPAHVAAYLEILRQKMAPVPPAPVRRKGGKKN